MTQEEDFSGPSAKAQEAERAIRAIGVTNCIPFLIRWLQPPWEDSQLLGASLECFKIFGPEANAAIPDLHKILTKPVRSLDDMSAQTEAGKALSYLGREAVPVMLSVITNMSKRHERWILIDSLANFRTNAVSALPAILSWRNDPDEFVRLGCLKAYVAIQTNNAASIQYLLTALKDTDGLVRRDAAEMLGYVAKGNKDALPILRKALQDPDWQVRSGAITGLGGIGVEPDVVVPLLVEKLHDENWILRRCAAYALGEVNGKEAFDALMKATDDAEGFVREIVFQSLNRIDPEALKRSGKTFANSGPRRSR